MAIVNVEVELDDFDLHEILSEIKYRYEKSGIRGKSNKDVIDDFIKQLNPILSHDISSEVKVYSLLDELKVDFVVKNFDKISLNDLENIIKT